MENSEFEEKEYESPLYQELLDGSSLIWTPGQVFESKVGIDCAVYTKSAKFWSIAGICEPAGINLDQIEGSTFIDNASQVRALPNFDLNLFIQAKRPHQMARSREDLKIRGISKPYKRFSLTKHQQELLENLSDSLGNKAHVCYASPNFVSQKSLYSSIVSKTMVSRSTFPPASILKGHTKWNYNTSGTTGVANGTAKTMNFERLDTSIEKLVSLQDTESDRTQNIETTPENYYFAAPLEELANGIKLAFAKTDSLKTNKNRDFLSSVRFAENQLPAYPLNQEVRNYFLNYMYVSIFCQKYSLSWLTLGRER